jgi:hypothetical protein
VEYEFIDQYKTVCKQVSQNLSSNTDADGDYISKDEISDGTYLVIKPIASLADCKQQCVDIKKVEGGTDCHGVEYFPPKEKCDIFTQPFSGSAKNNGRSCSEYVVKGSASELTFLTWKTKTGKGVQKAGAIKSAFEFPSNTSKPDLNITLPAKKASANYCHTPPCDAASNAVDTSKDVCNEPGLSCSDPKKANFWLIGLSAGVVAVVACVALFTVRRSKIGGVSASVSSYAAVLDDQTVIKTGI